MRKIAATFALLITFSACAADAPAPVKLAIAAPAAKINLDVRSISFADRNGIQPVNSPYTTNDFHPTIAEAIRQWSTDHLQAVGTSNDANVIIKDASLTAQTLPHSDNWFKRNQGIKYTAHAEVEIEINGGAGNYAMASAEATRFETLPENPSLIERKNAYNTVLNGLMRDLDQNLQNSIQNHMQRYIITAPIIR